MKKNVLIIILVGIICLGVGFGGSYMFLKQKSKCEEVKCDENNDVTKCNASLDEENHEQFTGTYDQLLDKINDLSGLEYLNRNFSTDEITNLEAIKFALRFIDEKYDDDFSLDRVNEITMKYLGKKVKGEDIPCSENKDVMVFIYDEESKMFKNNEEHGGHGGMGIYSPIVLNRIVDINVEKNLYTVSVKKAFAISKTDTGYITAYYKTYDDAYNGINKLFDIDESNEDFMEVIDYYYPEVEFNKISNDKLNTYTYVFEKNENNEFLFKSYKIK